MTYVFFCLLYFPKERAVNQYKSKYVSLYLSNERIAKEEFAKWLLIIEEENKECVILNMRYI